MYDNQPAADGNDFNYVGIGACRDHAQHVEITDDEWGDVTPQEVDPEGTGDNGKGAVDDDSEGGGGGVVVVLIIIIILAGVAGGLWWYRRKQREGAVTFSSRGSGEE